MAIALGYLQTGKINNFSINGEQTQMGQKGDRSSDCGEKT
jgi:hypothetical protein